MSERTLMPLSVHPLMPVSGHGAALVQTSPAAPG